MFTVGVTALVFALARRHGGPVTALAAAWVTFLTCATLSASGDIPDGTAGGVAIAVTGGAIGLLVLGGSMILQRIRP